MAKDAFRVHILMMWMIKAVSFDDVLDSNVRYQPRRRRCRGDRNQKCRCGSNEGMRPTYAFRQKDKMKQWATDRARNIASGERRHTTHTRRHQRYHAPRSVDTHKTDLSKRTSDPVLPRTIGRTETRPIKVLFGRQN